MIYGKYDRRMGLQTSFQLGDSTLGIGKLDCSKHVPVGMVGHLGENGPGAKFALQWCPCESWQCSDRARSFQEGAAQLWVEKEDYAYILYVIHAAYVM